MNLGTLRTASVAVALMTAGIANASMLGQTVNFSALFPDASTVLADGGNVIVGPGVEYPRGFMLIYQEALQVDITNTRVFFSYDRGSDFTSAAFNGYQLTVLGGGTLTASLDTNLTTLTPVSWEIVNGNTLQVNMSGLNTNAAFDTVFSLGTRPGTTVIPVPGALVLALSGLALLGATARRTRR